MVQVQVTVQDRIFFFQFYVIGCSVASTLSVAKQMECTEFLEVEVKLPSGRGGGGLGGLPSGSGGPNEGGVASSKPLRDRE